MAPNSSVLNSTDYKISRRIVQYEQVNKTKNKQLHVLAEVLKSSNTVFESKYMLFLWFCVCQVVQKHYLDEVEK